MSDYEGIRRTHADYCHFIDDAQFDAFSELFSDDAEFAIGADNVVRGRAEIAAVARALVAVMETAGIGAKHLTLNSAIDIDGATATARSDFMGVGFGNGTWNIIANGRYVDTLVRTDRWRFSSRKLEFFRDEVPVALRDVVPVPAD